MESEKFIKFFYRNDEVDRVVDATVCPIYSFNSTTKEYEPLCYEISVRYGFLSETTRGSSLTDAITKIKVALDNRPEFFKPRYI